MKTSTEGFQQCYNVQTVVDGEHQIIVATPLGPEATDQGRMMPLLDEVERHSGSCRRWRLRCNEANPVALVRSAASMAM